MSDSNSGVRNLRAMFENQSTASSPEPRGRSPAKFNADGHAPATSKIRASFVSVEPSAHVAARDLGATKGTTDGLNSPTAHRRESFSLSAEADDDAIAELKKEVSHEKEERKNSTAVPETIPEQAVATRESSQAPPPIRELQSTVPNLGSIMKGSDFPDSQAAAEDKSDFAEEPAVEEPAHDVAAPEPPSDDIPTKLADLSLEDVPADNPDKIVSGAQEEASLKPADPKEEAAVSGGQALPPPTEVLPSTNSIAASEPVPSVSSTTPAPETNATFESVPAPVAAVEAPEVDSDVIDNAPAVEVVEDVPATEVVEDAPATEVVENALDPDITESALVTEPAENISGPQPADNASLTSVADTTLSTKPAETVPPPPEVSESSPSTNKDNGTSSDPITNGRAQKPSAISTAKAGSAKTTSSKNPPPKSPELVRVPKTPTTPKRHVPLSSAKSPAPAKNSPKAAVSKDTAASTKSAAAPKASSKAAVSKEPPKVSAPAARTSRSVPRQSTSASSAGTLAKGKTPVENKVPAARSSSAVSASRERKAPTAAASKDSKATTAAAHKDPKPTNIVASKAPRTATVAASKDTKAASAAASKEPKEATKAHTTSPGGFKKPRPKSPTKPVGLPSRLTAPTAASSAKQGEDAKITRKPPTASRPTQPRTAAAAPTAKKPARASLAPSTAPAKRPESRASTAGGANEGFLARMMRPTTSSASKTHEKPASPPRRGASVKAASKPTNGQESTVAKGKKKVSEVADKAKEAVTNGHSHEHAASEDAGPGAAENTIAGSANDEIPAQSPADETETLPEQREEPEQPEQPEQPVDSIVVPEDTKIAT